MSVTLYLHLGDCVEVLKGYEDGSIGAVVSDPPYGLEFMGKEWDRLDGVGTGGASFTTDGMGKGFKALPSYSGAPNPLCLNCGGSKRGRDRKGFRVCRCDNPEFPNIGKEQGHGIQEWHARWLNEAFRVLRPGGVIKAFSGTRTYHRMAAAMQESGFEGLRVEAWCYGSGFPKSMNISKAMDKQAGRINTSIVALKKELRALFDASGKSRTTIDKECGFRACNYLSYPEPGKQHDPWFTVLPSQAKWQVMKQVLGVEGDFEAELDGFFQEAVREVIGFKKVIPGVAFSSDGPGEIPVTIPATEAAQRWDGWGTALKPSWEPVIVGRKPA